MLRTIARVILGSTLTSIATTAAVMILSKRDTGHPAAGLNAVSHILWGDEAGRRNHFDLKHTALGTGLNSMAMLSWSAVGELLPRPRGPLGAIRNGLLLSGLAYVTDYYVVPRRLTPGFEKRLSRESMLETYLVLAGAYALGSVLA
jgi:hypothetical protein